MKIDNPMQNLGIDKGI